MSSLAPSDTELGLIEKFRHRVDDILVTEEHRSDHFLVRWIRAREGNLDKAEAMLRNSFKWREENETDAALKRPIDPYIKENYPFYSEGTDKLGHPVVEVHVGAWDLRKAMDAGKEQEFYDYVDYYFENALQKIRESNKDKKPGEFPNTQFVYIVDWEGYSYAQLMHWKSVQGLLKFGSQYEAHYPEILFRCYCINCPAIFPLFMALLKPLIAKKTLEKIIIHGSNRDEWEPVLKELIDSDQLWSRLGGTRPQKIE